MGEGGAIAATLEPLEKDRISSPGNLRSHNGVFSLAVSPRRLYGQAAADGWRLMAVTSSSGLQEAVETPPAVAPAPETNGPPFHPAALGCYLRKSIKGGVCWVASAKYRVQRFDRDFSPSRKPPSTGGLRDTNHR